MEEDGDVTEENDVDPDCCDGDRGVGMSASGIEESVPSHVFTADDWIGVCDDIGNIGLTNN